MSLETLIHDFVVVFFYFKLCRFLAIHAVLFQIMCFVCNLYFLVLKYAVLLQIMQFDCVLSLYASCHNLRCFDISKILLRNAHFFRHYFEEKDINFQIFRH